ncbi:MAG: UDP-3-O-(3-hydroxymyristoyl)glucosamine N-acyltransferase [Acidobacteria bacterium]|nr:UDP-3-O-(3-hydroxymyristoyl)glucosamine N-acyltransferase [Acidobacteriota bacterium]
MPTIAQIAALVGAEPAAGCDGSALIARVSAFDHAAPDAVVFAIEPKALADALKSAAGLVLASAALQPRTPATPKPVLWVRDARYAFAQVASMLQPKPSGAIHPAAHVADSATVGEGSSIGPGTTLGDAVVIGRDCVIGPNVTIYPGTSLGDRVVVQAGAVLGSTGFGYARDAASGRYLLFPQQGTLAIDDDVEIGANTTIDRGALGETRIGSGTKIDNLVHIGHNCLIGNNVIIAAQTGISGSSVVEAGAILGGQVGIGEHATVGTGVILGGGAGVLTGKKLRGPGEVFWGRPARPLKEYLRDLARLKHR